VRPAPNTIKTWVISVLLSKSAHEKIMQTITHPPPPPPPPWAVCSRLGHVSITTGTGDESLR